MGIEWQLFYECNKVLDNEFNKKYYDITDMHEKNCIELLVELGEFINETKCFKYWSIKKANVDNLYEEASDVLQMILYFYHYYDIKKLNLCKIEKTNNLIFEINELFNNASKLLTKGNKNLCKKVLARFMYIVRLLNMDEKMLLDTCYKKNKINYERLNNNY